MSHTVPHIRKTLKIKNKQCPCCSRLLTLELHLLKVTIIELTNGCATIEFSPEQTSLQNIEAMLLRNGMGLVRSKEEETIDNIKQAVNELIHMMNNVNSIVQKTDYLVEKLGMSYQSMSKLFSKHEQITLEKYIIQNKIYRIKNLIDSNEYSIGEIAYIMDYSSVQHLSNQFKRNTGITISEYKNR